MTTGDKFVNLCEKRLLGLTSFKDYFLDFLRAQFQELVIRAWDLDGTLGSSKVAISGSGNDEFDLDTGKTGTDGNGRFLKTAAAYETNVQFENANTIVYDIGLHYAEKPSGINPNPRTSEPEYVNWEEVVGLRDEPDSVSEVSGKVHAVVDSVFESGVSNAGRKCLIFMKVPAEGATSEGIAVEECTVQWDSSNNYIETTTGALGQSTISTTAADYLVLAMGPAVRRNTDLEAASEYWYIGTVTGVGAGNPPTVFDIADQRLIQKSLATLLENLVYSNINNNFTGENDFADLTTLEEATFSGEADFNNLLNINASAVQAAASVFSVLNPAAYAVARYFLTTDFPNDLASDYLLVFQLGANASGTGTLRFYAYVDGLMITIGAKWTTSHNWAFDTGVSTATAFRVVDGGVSVLRHTGSSPWTTWDDTYISVTSAGIEIDNSAGDPKLKFKQVQTLVKNIGPAQVTPRVVAGSPTWDYNQNGVDTPYWESETDSSYVFVPITFPIDGAGYDMTVEAMVKPGAVRAYSDRMRLQLLGSIPNWSTPAQPTFDEVAEDYDDGTTDIQILSATESISRVEGRYIVAAIRSGNTGSSAKDRLYALRVTITTYYHATHWGSV